MIDRSKCPECGRKLVMGTCGQEFCGPVGQRCSIGPVRMSERFDAAERAEKAFMDWQMVGAPHARAVIDAILNRKVDDGAA